MDSGEKKIIVSPQKDKFNYILPYVHIVCVLQWENFLSFCLCSYFTFNQIKLIVLDFSSSANFLLLCQLFLLRLKFILIEKNVAF